MNLCFNFPARRNINQLFILTLMVCTAVFAVTRINHVDFQAINFSKAIYGKKLNAGIIQNISVDSDSVCQLACVQDFRCLSYNFATISDIRGKFSCQLSDSDRFSGHQNFTKDEDVLYKGINVSHLSQMCRTPKTRYLK